MTRSSSVLGRPPRLGVAAVAVPGRWASLLAGLILLGGCQTVGLPELSELPDLFSGGPDLHDQLSDEDVAMAVGALQDALDDGRQGETVSWSNPQTGSSGAVTPRDSYMSSTGFVCRNFTETLRVGGATDSYDLAACRDGDRWRLV